MQRSDRTSSTGNPVVGRASRKPSASQKIPHESFGEAPGGQTGAVVIGGGYSALGVVRSLGRRKIPVAVLTRELDAASVSRYSTLVLPWAPGQVNKLDYLLNLGAAYGLTGWALYPTDDEPTSLIARNHEALSQRYRLITPPWEVISRVHDKWQLHELATEHGIDQPWACRPRSRDDLERIECRLPAVLKPTIKEDTNDFTFAKAWLARSRDELLTLYDRACGLVSPDTIMVQELIPGTGNDYAFAALVANRNLVASAVVRRPRQYPIGFGRASTYVETVDVPEIDEAAHRLLAALPLTGLVHIGFKRDPRDGRYKLLDVNPRVWGSHTLGRQAEIDFAYLQWRLLHNLPVPSYLRAPAGLRWARLVTDLYVSMRLLFRGKLSLPAYLRSLAAPIELAAFALDDPLPALKGLPLIRHKSWPPAVLREMQIIASGDNLGTPETRSQDNFTESDIRVGGGSRAA